MSKKDSIHGAVRAALEKDGWIITADPLTITYGDAQVQADLRAEKPAPDGARTVIVVEVKSFPGRAGIHDVFNALGQYGAYRDLLTENGETYSVYLAITNKIYEKIFTRKITQLLMKRQRVALLVIDEQREEITQWIE